MYMGATRTQIYLTKEQRRQLDARRKREGRTLASLVREAIDSYLERDDPAAVRAAFDAAFGVSPNFEVPPRDEWERRFERIYGKGRPDG